MGEIDWLFELGALIPSIGVGLLFWFILKAILKADRLQREAEQAAEAEYLATQSMGGSEPKTNPADN